MNWYSAWRTRQAERRRAAGYAFAAGKLLKGDLTSEQLSSLADNPWEYTNDFDRGVLDACFDWEWLKKGRQ